MVRPITYMRNAFFAVMNSRILNDIQTYNNNVL